MRGPHGNAASSAASVKPLPSGSVTSTSAACGRSFLAATVAASTVAASPTTESPNALKHADRQRPKRGVVIDQEPTDVQHPGIVPSSWR